MKNCNGIAIEHKNPCSSMEFINNINPHDFIKGKIYSFINEHGEEEKGECVSYSKVTGNVKLKPIE
tara:strand:- start:473 stop:670 length:198 start_codon:yes stop_codon:yes gene_type:complete